MGRSMYNFGKHTKEKARQSKQLEKAAKRLLAKQQKAAIIIPTLSEFSDIAESALRDEINKVASGLK
ncbi:MAG: hypothetical protein L7F78_09660 [Syntrophales bacterium LBB04]|nr:hypothetical protein [Syntrophales bacterium LBB04]